MKAEKESRKTTNNKWKTVTNAVDNPVVSIIPLNINSLSVKISTCDKVYDKGNVGRKGFFFILYFQVAVQLQGKSARDSSRAGAWRQGLKWKPGVAPPTVG